MGYAVFGILGFVILLIFLLISDLLMRRIFGLFPFNCSKNNVYVCPNCNSAEIFRLCIDLDWENGLSFYEPVNDKSKYTENQWKIDVCYIPDIELFHCLECNHMWQE